MDLIFNELSINPLATDKTEAFKRVDLFISSFKEASKFKYNRIKFDRAYENIELTEGYSLSDYCNEPKNRIKGTLLRGLFKNPFIEDDSEEADRYIQNTFQIKKDEDEIGTYGIAAAYLYSIPAFGFCSEPFWGNCFIELHIKGIENKTAVVFCGSIPEHFDNVTFQDWNNKVALIDLKPNETIAKIFPDYVFENKSINDILFLKKDFILTNRLLAILKDIKINPFSGGLGKTESLKGIVDTYSKRLDGGNRVVYEILTDMKVKILSCLGHYDDK